MELVIRPGGDMHCIYDEQLPLAALGSFISAGRRMSSRMIGAAGVPTCPRLVGRVLVRLTNAPLHSRRKFAGYVTTGCPPPATEHRA